MAADDTILWRSFTHGDRPSFDAIYRRYFDVLYEYGMRRTGDEELTRDTIQDLFVKLWTNRRQISETGHVKYYLLTAFKNSLLNAMVRRGTRKEQLTGDPDDFYLHFTEPLPISESERGERTARLLEAMNGLSARQREIIYLRYFEELDYDQIAGLLDISVGATYKLHYRALDALKDILQISRRDLLLLLIALRSAHFH